MNKLDRYTHLFNKNHLMGPNSIRLLNEMLEKCPIENGLRILDLGCGKGLTTHFLVRETNAQVFATDLWVSAAENYNQFIEWGIAENTIPIHADANDLPYADNFFDAIVSIDSFHYFAHNDGFFETRLLPLLKKGGRAIIAIPALKCEFDGTLPEVYQEWLSFDENDYELFHSLDWWVSHFDTGAGLEVTHKFELDSADAAWNDWFASGHEFALRDEEFFKKGLDEIILIIGFVLERK